MHFLGNTPHTCQHLQVFFPGVVIFPREKFCLQFLILHPYRWQPGCQHSGSQEALGFYFARYRFPLNPPSFGRATLKLGVPQFNTLPFFFLSGLLCCLWYGKTCKDLTASFTEFQPTFLMSALPLTPTFGDDYYHNSWDFSRALKQGVTSWLHSLWTVWFQVSLVW